MPKTIHFEGKDYEFPDDATDAEISSSIENATTVPGFSTVVRAIPGEARRQLASSVAGADIALGDLLGSKEMGERGRGVKREIAAEAALERPPNMGVLEEGILQGGASALTQLPAMAVAGLAMPAVAPLALFRGATTAMGIQTGFSKYGDERQAGFAPARSSMHAMVEGLIEKYTEYLPLKELAGGNVLWREARRYLVKEFAGEQLATLGQDINAKLSDQPDLTLGDYFRDALITAIATPVAGGVQLGVASAGQAAARALQSDPESSTPSVPPAPVPAVPNAGLPVGAEVPPNAGAALPVAQPAVVAPPQTPPPSETPAEIPKPQTTVRVYLAGEHDETFEATFDQNEALTAAGRLQYVDMPFDQLTKLQGEVPETRRLEFDGTNRIVLPKESSLTWKSATPPTATIPTKPVNEDPTYVAGVETPAPVRAASAEPLPIDTSAVRVEGIKASAIKFPDKMTRTLWDYGAALTRYETTTKPADSVKLNRLRDYAKEATGIKEDAQIAEQAQRYVYGTILSGLRKAEAGTYNAPNLETAIKTQKAHEEHISTGLASKVKPGEVSMSADLPYGDVWLKQMQTYLQVWVKTFSPKMKIVVLGVQEGSQTRARTWYYGGVHYVYVPKPQNKVLGLYVLSHEFGHMIVSEHLNDPRYTRVKDQLIEEYSNLLMKSSGGTAGQFVREFTSPVDVLAGQVDPMATAMEFIDKAGLQTITFDEWMADQMVRYMHTRQSHLKPEESKSFWKPLFDALQGFFDKVVKKFAPTQTYSDWVESLRSVDSQSAVAMMTAPPSPRVDKSVSHEVNDKYEYTTRVLDRLPNKLNVKKVTIYGELGRADVKKEEREMIGRILHDIPGESVETKLFKERVLGEVVPLSLNQTNEYASYGVGNIGYTISPQQDSVVPKTHIWEAQGVNYQSPHFNSGDAYSYWAHTRGFTSFDFVPGKGRQPAAWNIIELQSDLEQHEQTLDDDAKYEYVRQIDDGKVSLELIRELEGALDQNESAAVLDTIIIGDNSPAPHVSRIGASNMLGPRVWQTFQEHIAALEANDQVGEKSTRDRLVSELAAQRITITAKIQDAEAALQVKDEIPKALPKRWWELVLRHETTWAARQGLEQVRLASADTVAMVEGWENEWFGVQAEETEDPNRLRLIRRSFTGQVENAVEGTEEQVRQLQNNKIHPTVVGIYNRYANEITKFVKREFNAKPITDDKGNTWFEWETTKALAEVPIIYYNTARAVAETGEKVAKGANVPELPENFVRFQGFLQNTLQLNQMAKILPDVVGLQRYRTSMRSLHALKAKLFEGPNDRIHEWHKIGRIQAKRVELALRDEQLGGEHWTALVQTDVDGKMVWVHTPTASFDKFMRDRGISKEGQELFLGIKNDYLSTLTAMEEVVRRHTSAFFEKNEIVLAQRTARIDEEFAKLRTTPYLPDMRFGKYSVQVRAGHNETVDGREIKVGELVYWEKFESERGRNKRLDELKRDLRGHTVSGSYDSDLVSTMRGLPQSVMDAVAETLNSDPSTALTADQTSALEQIAFDQTAAGKFAKYLGTPAKHIAGASKDLRRAYAAYHWKTANAIAKLRYFRALTGALSAVRADSRKVRAEGGTSDPHDKLVEYMQNNFNYVMNPQNEYEQLRAFVSLWYLWGSAKTAVMNLTSVPVLTFPYLWARFGNLQAQGALLRAIKDVTQYWRNPTKVSADRQRVLEQLKADGVTDQSFASMLASVSDGGVAFEKIIPSWEGAGTGEAVDVARRFAWKVTSLGMMPFRVIEQFNRQITGLAAYDLMVAKTGKTLSSGDTEAYNFARDAVDYTQNEYGAWNRPPLMQGKQSIFLLFFSFVQNMSFLMFGGDKAWWRAMLVLGALAGLQGLPGMDNLIDMFNWAARKMSGQHVDLRNEARAVARELGMNPDMVMHGISHNWLGLGWDTSTSVGSGRIIPGTDAIFGIGKFENRFLHATSEIGGPVGSLMLSFLQALADDNPNQLLRWNRALPPVLRNIEKTYGAIENDAWTNARGRPVAGDPTGAELVGQTLGFSPTRRTERGEELRAVKDVVEFYKERRTNLMEMVWAAKRTHDTEVMRDVRVAIAEYNSKVPSPHLRISSEDISSSMKSREKLDLETSAMRSPQRRYRDIYRYIDELY